MVNHAEGQWEGKLLLRVAMRARAYVRVREILESCFSTIVTFICKCIMARGGPQNRVGGPADLSTDLPGVGGQGTHLCAGTDLLPLSPSKVFGSICFTRIYADGGREVFCVLRAV